MRYYLGDKVKVRVSEDRSIIFDVDYWDVRYVGLREGVYKIIGREKGKNGQYILLVEKREAASWRIEGEELGDEEWLGGIGQWEGQYGFYIREMAIGGKDLSEYGKRCDICKEWNEYVNEEKYRCYVCRKDYRNEYKDR